MDSGEDDSACRFFSRRGFQRAGETGISAQQPAGEVRGGERGHRRRLEVVRIAWPALLQQHVEDKGSGEGEASDDYCHVGSRRGDEVALRDTAPVAQELHSTQDQGQAS